MWAALSMPGTLKPMSRLMPMSTPICVVRFRAFRVSAGLCTRSATRSAPKRPKTAPLAPTAGLNDVA
jgi:hypothetical protein